MKNFGSEEAMSSADVVVTSANMEFLQYLTIKGVILLVDDPTCPEDSAIQIKLHELPTFLSDPHAFFKWHGMSKKSYEGYIN
jgi:hypothetical protein